jgi:hypothetical protein
MDFPTLKFNPKGSVVEKFVWWGVCGKKGKGTRGVAGWLPPHVSFREFF